MVAKYPIENRVPGTRALHWLGLGRGPGRPASHVGLNPEVGPGSNDIYIYIFEHKHIQLRF